MFKDATAFNQDLSGWCVFNRSEPGDFSTGSALTFANSPLWGKEFTIALTSGSQTQTVTATSAITPIQYTVSSICTTTLIISASNLPSGVSAALSNNVATISGTPAGTATGTFNYSLTVSGSTTGQTVTGTIIVLEPPKTYVPDDVFEQRLIDMGYDDTLDDYVLTSNISGITTIDLQRTGVGTPQVKEIKDITGIEDFTSLTYLMLINNGITSSIDLSKMSNLSSFIASSNLFPSIDVTNNPNLTQLRIESSLINTIDVTNNPNLTYLMVGGTNLSSLDISNNNLLQVLSISNLSAITSLDVSQKTNLQELYAIGTGLNSLDVSNNSQLTRCYTQSNSGNLTCVQVNQTQLSNIPIGFTKDSSTFYSLDCFDDSLGIRVESGQGGSVSISSRLQNQTLSGGQSNTYNNGYHPGEIVTLTATPDSGKTFAGWNCSAHCGTNSFTSSLTIDVVLDNDTIDISASFN
jgi:hypothetical protein